jgi:hypothetical protein
MNKAVYVFGIATGVILACSWKFIVREGVKAGVQAGRAIRTVADQAVEDLEDASAEAMDELAREEQREKG